MLRLFGHPSHRGAGSFPSRGYDIIAVLALQPDNRVNRKALASLLWPETSDELALGNLRYVLHAVRQWTAQNSIALIEVSPTEIQKAPQPISDLDHFHAASVPKNLAELSTYVASFHRELLEGHRIASRDFEAWLSLERTKLSQAFVDTILSAARDLSGPPVDTALLAAEGRLPFDERIIVARVRNLIDSRRRHSAIAAFDQYRSKYRIDLGVDLPVQVRQTIGLLLPETLPGTPATQRASVVTKAGPTKDHLANPGMPTVLILPPPRSDRSIPALHFVSRALVSEVTILLGRMRTFAMFAPHTARRVAPDDPLLAAESVGASYVVSTEVTQGRSGSHLGFCLIHTDSQEILVADHVPIDSEPVDDRFATGIATAVSNHISAVEVRRFRRTGEASAFTHYLLGQERLTYDLKGIRKARSHFRRAATLSPMFAPAHAMIARSLTYEWLVLGREDPALLKEAHQLAAHAAELDPLLPSGPWEMGHALLYMQRFDESLEQVEAALARSPHVADLLADHADIFVHLADGHKAKAAITRAMELNPIAPDEYFWVLGASDFLLEDYAATLRSFHRMSNTKPVARLMAACYAMIGDLEMAGRHRDRWLEDYPDFKVEDWVRVIPMRDRRVAEQIVGAMRAAGFH